MITLLLGLIFQIVVLLIIAVIVYIVLKPPFDIPFLSKTKLPDWTDTSSAFIRGGEGDLEATVRQMRNRSHARALAAIETARSHGWLTDGSLAGANLRLANWVGADLRGADLPQANLSYANLTRTHLEEANLSGADLATANLQQARLDRADLRSARLDEADLSGATLVGTLYNKETRWPSGFVVDASAIDVDQLVEEEQQRLRS